MREWARSDDDAAASVRAADQRVLAAVRQAFLDYGFDAEDADLRANATFAVGIGFLHLAGPHPSARSADRREGFLEIMLKHCREAARLRMKVPWPTTHETGLPTSSRNGSRTRWRG